MRAPSRSHAFALWGTATLCLAVFLLSWSFGGASAYPWQLLSPSEDLELLHRILIDIRLPRVVAACLIGGALAAAGVLTQGLFRNPLASPSVVGISSGGVLGAILAFYFGFNLINLWVLPLFALVGCMLTTTVLLRFARDPHGFPIEDLLLIGFALNGILSALTSFVLSLALNDFDKAPAMMNWMLGTLSGKTWEHCLVASGPLILGVFFAQKLAYRFNVLSLGNDVAQTLGLDLKRLRTQAVLLVSILVGTSVSMSGMMPFIGLIVPHLTRMMVGPDHRQLLGLSVINGMTLLMLADLVARILIPPQEVQVGVLISLIGSPFFLWMLYQRRRQAAL
ncbi:FecCD family ABC transporter permease [Oligoflexus tunisiensis]|uniref:FecCD family ABC transporter permease n=1 Tax=Oligoflexus tunisiensis TaxID=708132 RepID=UPI00159F1961|nr:iron ABC transporter permease [Oligoflexus tunisiensis]